LAVSKISNGLGINNDKTNEKLDPEGEEKSLKMGIGRKHQSLLSIMMFHMIISFFIDN
jgi:hypothetical protein